MTTLTPYLSARVSLSSVAESDDGLRARSQSLRMYTCLILALWWPAIISPFFYQRVSVNQAFVYSLNSLMLSANDRYISYDSRASAFNGCKCKVCLWQHPLSGLIIQGLAVHILLYTSQQVIYIWIAPSVNRPDQIPKPESVMSTRG
jgi:hypothetical protein